MMIVPAGVKVHLALGYTDMRKGMDGLADAGPGHAEARIRSRAICSPSGASERRSSRSCSGTATGCACSPSGIDQGGFVWPRMVESRRHGDAVAGAAGDADRGHRLALARARLETCEGGLKLHETHA